MKPIIDYFGTDLFEPGHYRFELTENSMIKLYYDFDKFPFHPEHLTNNLNKVKQYIIKVVDILYLVFQVAALIIEVVLNQFFGLKII